MEKRFYGVTLVVKVGDIATEPADAYITDDPSISGSNVVHVDLSRGSSRVFENIFRQTLEALLSLNKVGYHRTVAIGKFVRNTGKLNNYQILRAILCGMFGFCQLVGKNKLPKCTIRKIILVIPMNDLSVSRELEKTENFKDFTDVFGERPSMQEILQRRCCPR